MGALACLRRHPAWKAVSSVPAAAAASASLLSYLCHPAPVPARSVVGEAALPSSPRRCWADSLLLLLLLPRHARAHIASSAVACCCCCRRLAPSRAQPPLCSSSGASRLLLQPLRGGGLSLLLPPSLPPPPLLPSRKAVSCAWRCFRVVHETLPLLAARQSRGGTVACMAGLNSLPSPFFFFILSLRLCLILLSFFFGHY